MIEFYKKGSITENESNLLIRYAAKATNNIVEIGGFQGRTSIQLANNCDYHVYVIDSWNGNKVDEGVYLNKNVFDSNIKAFNLSDRVTGIKGYSVDILKTWNKPIGLLFIDGCHTYKAVKNDTKWIEYVIKGGFIAFHDYSDQYKDRVVKAVDEVKNSLRYVDSVESLIIFQK